MEIVREVFKQMLQGCVDGSVLDFIVVIQHQYDGPLLGCEVVDQDGGDRLSSQRLRGAEQFQSRCVDIFL